MTASDAGSEARAADPLAALIEANAQARAALMEAVDALPAAASVRLRSWGT